MLRSVVHVTMSYITHKCPYIFSSRYLFFVVSDARGFFGEVDFLGDPVGGIAVLERSTGRLQSKAFWQRHDALNPGTSGGGPSCILQPDDVNFSSFTFSYARHTKR